MHWYSWEKIHVDLFFRFAPSAKAPLMKKFQKDLNSSTFMYQGRTVTASTRATDQKKKNITLKSLGIGNKNAAEATSKGVLYSTLSRKKNTMTNQMCVNRMSFYAWPLFRHSGVVFSALDFTSEGQWFEAQCCSLTKETFTLLCLPLCTLMHKWVPATNSWG